MAEKGSLSINSENMFPIIKKWLYSDHDIFYRELISNGCDAVTKLKKLDMMGEYTLPEGYKGKIEVICDAEKKAARGIFSEGKSTKKTKVLMVNVDEIMRQNPGMASRLFDSFDLSSLPFIFETDRKGYIQRRYITLVTQ